MEERVWSLAGDPEGGRVFLGMGNGKVRVLRWTDGEDIGLWTVSFPRLFFTIGDAACFLAWVPGRGLACLAGKEFRLLDPGGRVQGEYKFPDEADLLVPLQEKKKWIFFLSNGTLWILGPNTP